MIPVFKFGPQCITRRGIETVVVFSVQEYKKLTSPTPGLVEFFRKSPLYGVDLDIERDQGHVRAVEF